MGLEIKASIFINPIFIPYFLKGDIMTKKPPLFSDLAQMASGAASAFGGVKGDIDVMLQSQIERMMAKKGMVSREDFEAAEARISALASRIATLESHIEEMQNSMSAKPAKKSAKKS